MENVLLITRKMQLTNIMCKNIHYVIYDTNFSSYFSRIQQPTINYLTFYFAQYYKK